MSASVGEAPARRGWTVPSAALVAAGVTVVLWASAFVGILAVGVDFRPGPLTLGRLLVGSLVLGGVKPVLAKMPAFQATWLGCTVGMVACLPFGPALLTEIGRASTGSILGLTYLGVFATAVAFTTWAYALTQTPAGQLGAMTYLVPVVAAGMSWVLLDEVPPALSFVGAPCAL